MLDIVLTILTFNALIIIFKLFDRYRINNLLALVVNYLVAAICGIFFLKVDFSLGMIIQSSWIYHAFLIGILFIAIFYLYALGTQKVGVAIATIANKLSLLIPVGVALIFYPNDSISFTKIIGFLLAIMGIYFSTTNKNSLAFEKKYVGLIMLIFFGQGIADTIFNNAQQRVVNEDEKVLFITCILFIACLTGLFFFLARLSLNKTSIDLKSIIGGIALGIPNFATLIFFFNALENSNLASSQVFPIVSMGIIVASAISGLFLFRERLSMNNWIGIVIALLSIYIITFL